MKIRMKLRKDCNIISIGYQLFAILFVCALVNVALGQHGVQDYNDGEQRQGLFGTLISPLTSTLRRAANHLFGYRLNNVNEFVHDNFDRVQAQAFQVFMRIYNKTYSPSEIPKRMRLFFERRKQIEDSIRAYAAGKLPFMMRENAYIDWDEQELKALTGVSPPKSINELTPEEHKSIFDNQKVSQVEPAVFQNDRDYYALDDEQVPTVSRTLALRTTEQDGTDKNDIEDDGAPLNMIVRAPVRIPAQKDWRESGCVAGPRDQRTCGCCYAIATMSVVESMLCLNKVSSPILSPQQIIDCSTPRAGYKNYGCEGGWPTRVLHYLQDVRSVARETCYPLVLRQETCKLNRVKYVNNCVVSPNPSGPGPLRFKVINNERDMLYHVANTGPVVTVMRVTDKFLLYGKGIFDDNACSNRPDDVDHAIVIVGYGSENGFDYWLIKNSWGREWGQNGYGKYRRGKNACSIGHWGWVIL